MTPEPLLGEIPAHETHKDDSRIPYAKWEYVTVAFEAADTDTEVGLSILNPENPDMFRYEVVCQTNKAVIYHDASSTAAPWQRQLILLRASEPTHARLRISLEPTPVQLTELITPDGDPAPVSTSLLTGVLATAQLPDPLPALDGSALTNLTADNLTWGSNIVPVANLGTGTPSSTTFLRGDGAWVSISDGIFPTGGIAIVAFFGVACPTGWTRVSGSGEALYQKFLYGGGTSGATGGSAAHTHTIGFNTDPGGGTHTHTTTGGTDGEHDHTTSTGFEDVGVATDTFGDEVSPTQDVMVSLSDANHQHTITITNDGGHGHTTGNANEGDHVHAIDGTSDGPDVGLPPFYTVIFCTKD